jgi:hypothetical protein
MTGQLLRDATCPILAVPVPMPMRADQDDITGLAA